MIILLLLAILALLVLPDLCICKIYLSSCETIGWRYICWMPSLLLFLGLFVLVFVFLNGQSTTTMRWMGIWCVWFLCIVLPKLVFVLFSLLFRLFHAGQWSVCFSVGISILLMGYLIYGATAGVRHFRIREVTLSSDELPAGFDGYRIVHISDIHAGSWGANAADLQRAVRLINERQADLVLFTGDLVNDRAEEVDELLPVFSRIRAEDGVYSVLGNHDYGIYTKWENKDCQDANLEALKAKQAEMGWVLLDNTHRILHQGGDSIALIGVENCGGEHFTDRGDLPKASAGTEGMFKILMSHDPSHWRREVLHRNDIQLTLAGHTHGMQCSIFGFSPARYLFSEYDGLYRENDRYLYVNVGLGHIFPMRLGAWPEITIITLKTEDAEQQ